MSVLCTSFPLELRRIARSRAARVLAAVLAVALAMANFLAVAMPLSTAATGPMGNPDATRHEHCAGEKASIPLTHRAGHGADCACCIGKACACVPVFDALVVTVLPTSMPAPTRSFPVAAPRAYTAIETQPLRPPIV